DFVLNLLIFFIITTSFVKEPGVSVDRPEALTAEHRESGNILIAIRSNGDIWMDRRQVDLREVRPTVEGLHVEGPADPVVVGGDSGHPRPGDGRGEARRGRGGHGRRAERRGEVATTR